MPPQQHSLPEEKPINSELEKRIEEVKAKQKEQQDRLTAEKIAKEEAKQIILKQIEKEATEVLERNRLKKLSMPNIKPFDPENHKLSGKDYASGEKDEKDEDKN